MEGTSLFAHSVLLLTAPAWEALLQSPGQNWPGLPSELRFWWQEGNRDPRPSFARAIVSPSGRWMGKSAHINTCMSTGCAERPGRAGQGSEAAGQAVTWAREGRTALGHQGPGNGGAAGLDPGFTSTVLPASRVQTHAKPCHPCGRSPDGPVSRRRGASQRPAGRGPAQAAWPSGFRPPRVCCGAAELTEQAGLGGGKRLRETYASLQGFSSVPGSSGPSTPSAAVQLGF